MNKSTIGMVMLVGLVLTKAMISSDNDEVDNLFGRDNSLLAVSDESADIRSAHSSNTTLVPSSNLLAFNVSTPDYSLFLDDKMNHFSIAELDDLASTTADEKIVDENDIIPLESYSNTGYGMWKTSTEKINSKNDRPGAVPLDGGNTITDNISKLFPRTN